jgi:hypothetical protein
MYFIVLGINPVAYVGLVNYRHCVKAATAKVNKLEEIA